MSEVRKISTEVVIDGVTIEDGSVEAVEHYLGKLREAQRALDQARVYPLQKVPDAVEDTWRKELQEVERRLATHIGRVSPFYRDFSKNGLRWAVDEAKYRKELS